MKKALSCGNACKEGPVSGLNDSVVILRRRIP
jgi:hypothetical protein